MKLVVLCLRLVVGGTVTLHANVLTKKPLTTLDDMNHWTNSGTIARPLGSNVDIDSLFGV
jgi:hypothetical protein